MQSLPARVVLATSIALVAGCLDVRDFEGAWSGPRVGSDPVLRSGFEEDARATLVIDRVDLDDLEAQLTIDGAFDAAPIRPLPAAEADVLGDISFDGSPARVYLSFAEPMDGGADALVIAALYGDPLVEVRVLRGAPSPLYGIFSLRRAD